MKILMKIKVAITTTLLVLLASAVYAVVAVEAVNRAENMTLPLLFNGLAPGAIMFIIIKGFIKGWMTKLDKILDELIAAKNSHTREIEHIKTTQENCGNCPPNRRKGE